MEIKDNELLRQFEIETDKGLLSVEYSLQERRIFLTRLNNEQEITQIDSNDFIKGILEMVRERKLRVVPTHPKIVSFFRKNPSYKEMLPPGIRI
ncbi:GNAT family N-acetyltransferase [Myroides sp. LJL116]